MTGTLSARRVGTGPPLVLIHGGVGPRLTWERQEPLAQRWSLVIPSRRGFRPSPATNRQDFERDAADIAPLLGESAHLVGFSYGGVSAALLASSDPGRLRSLTPIEPPIYAAAPGDPEVEQLARLGDAFLAGSAGDEERREFMRRAGLDPEARGEHSDEIAEAIAAARGGRPPGEAEIDLDRIQTASVPTMVVSGDHHVAIERVCDGLADRLGSRREIVPGAGHAVPRAPGFNQLLEDFLLSVERGR